MVFDLFSETDTKMVFVACEVEKSKGIGKIGNIISSLGLFLAAAGLFYAGRQFQLSRILSRNQFLMQIFESMNDHNELHEFLTEQESSLDDWPNTRKDWIKVGRLLGIFERMSELIDDGLLSAEQVDRSFAYRLAPVMGLENVRNVVYAEKSSWVLLKRLVDRLEKEELYPTFLEEHRGKKTEVTSEENLSDAGTAHRTTVDEE